MAKCTITIEDLATGGVKILADPTFETLMAMDMSGHELTSAHGYLFALLNQAMKLSKQQGPIIREIPRIIS